MFSVPEGREQQQLGEPILNNENPSRRCGAWNCEGDMHFTKVGASDRPEYHCDKCGHRMQNLQWLLEGRTVLKIVKLSGGDYVFVFDNGSTLRGHGSYDGDIYYHVNDQEVF